MTKRLVLILAIALLCGARAALGQPMPQPSDSPAPAQAQPSPSPLPAAGVVPANLTLDVSGVPAADGNFLDAEIRKTLDRTIRPTLRPGSGINFGPITPWPILPLAAGTRAAVNVTVTLTGDSTTAPVTGTTTVTVENIAVQHATPSVLFLSDDPEYLQSEGLVFRGSASLDRGARLYYYHSDIGVPRDLDVVLSANAPARIQLMESEAGPDLDVMSAGHAVSRDFLRFMQYNEAAVVDVVPGKPFILRHALILQGEVVVGVADFHVMSGAAVTVSVIGSPAGGRPETYLNGPRVPFDGHGRHGTFDLEGVGPITASYTAGGPDVAVKYGMRTATPRNIDPSDPGHDYGDYGVLHRITFTLVNPNDAPQLVYLYEKPLGGPVRGSFLVDGQFKELGCVKMPQPYWLTTYQLPAHSTSASTTLTMPDGGSFYPVEFGVSAAQPQPYTPPIGSPEGCSPAVSSMSSASAVK